MTTDKPTIEEIRLVDQLCPHGWAQDVRCEDCGRSGFAWIGVNIEMEDEDAN